MFDVLIASLLAVFSEADDSVEMTCFAERKLSVLRRYLSLEQGPISHDTFRRVFQHVDTARFNTAFLDWVRQLLLDVTLCEDGHRLRHQRAAENLALVRKTALNLLRAGIEPDSLKVKHNRLGRDDA